MKKKLLVKASALACSLALIATGIQTAFAADKNYTLKKSFTVTDASAVKAETLFKIRNNTLDGTMSITEQGGSEIKVVPTNNNNALLGAITEVNGVDLTDSSVTVNEWSYNMTFEKPESGTTANFGFLLEWYNFNSTVSKQEDGTYAVTDGDTEFYNTASDIQLNDDGYYFYQLKGFTLGAQKLGGPITVGEESNSLGDSRYKTYPYDGNYGVYWKDTPTLNVSFTDNGDGTHKYSVKAVNIYTKDDTGYVKADDKEIKSFTVDGENVVNTGLVLFGAGNFSHSTSAITLSNISVKYDKNLDYTAEIEQFLKNNAVVETLYDGTFAPDKATANALKKELNTALSEYNSFDTEEKEIFDSNFPNFADKVSAALAECNNAAYGKFTANVEETVTSDKITSLETEDYVRLYDNRVASSEKMFVADANTVKYTNSQQHALGLGAITKINGVDLTADTVSVKEWSYTVTADNSADSKIGYLKSWNYIRKDAVSAVGMTSNTKLSDDGYSSLDIGISGIKSADIGGKATYDSEAGTWTYDDKEGISGYPFDSNFNYYWLGAPKFKVAYTDNNDGTHTYTVYATDIYSLADEVYTKIDDAKKVEITVNDTDEKALDFVMLAAGGYKGNSKDITISDISVKYSVEKDITDDCIAVLSAGNGIYEEFGDTLGDLVITNSNLAEVNTNLEALEASYNGASEPVKTAVDAKDFSKKLKYYKNYADAVAKTAHAELLGVQLKNESSVEASDLRFVVKYEANTASGYTVSSYGAVVVPNQVRGNNPDLTRKIDVVSGKENYFVDVNVESDTVTVDGDNRFYVNVTNSKGKPGLLFDCRPYVVYTNGTDEFTVYADNAVADTDVIEGQATKCALFAAKKLSEKITGKLGTSSDSVSYPENYTEENYAELIEKIGKIESGDKSVKISTDDKKAVIAFINMNYEAYADNGNA